mgnify:CR=1 FL=1
MEENLELKLQLTGNDVNARKIKDEFSQRFARSTGLEFSGIDHDYQMQVSLQVAGKKRTGKGSTIDKALEDATRGKDYDPKTVVLDAKMTAQVPYFLKTVEARALSENDAYQEIQDGMGSYQKVYGDRLVREPHEVDFKVINTRNDYKKVPPSVPKKKIIGEGTSKVSFDKALEAAPSNNNVKSTIYEATYTYKIFGEDKVPAKAGRKGRKATAVPPNGRAYDSMPSYSALI